MTAAVRRRTRPDVPPVLVIGLDGAPPELVFERWRADLPVIDGLMRRGIHGPLTSTIPAITVPAWTAMMTGRDPGQLGLYGFRNRVDRSYDNVAIASGRDVRHRRVWEQLSASGRRVAAVGVPQTYPIRPVNGQVVSCFLTPNDQSTFTYPPSLKAEVRSWVPGEFLLDVPNFRSENEARVLADLYRLADQHFEVCRRLLARERYDYFMAVDVGTDRIQHRFWHYMDPLHPRHEPGTPFEHAIHDYYVHLDGLIGGLLELVPDDTVVFVVSDHGAQAMAGGLAINEWLREDGFLAADQYPADPQPLSKAGIAWEQTVAWGEGGYYGRLSMNVAGREPSGAVAAADYDRTRAELRERAEALLDHAGRPLHSRAYLPEEIYREVRGIAPDLIVYFGQLTWRSVGKLGLRSRWTRENDTGLDDANHAQDGILIIADPRSSRRDERIEGTQIVDIAPTILTMFGEPLDEDIPGRAIRLEA